jgi:hypothetical protein
MRGTLASALVENYAESESPLHVEFLSDVRRAGRLSISPDVYEQVLKVKWRTPVTDLQALAAEMLDTVRLPFDITWIELPVMMGEAGAETEIEYAGVMLHKENGEIQCRAAMFSPQLGAVIFGVKILATRHDGFVVGWWTGDGEYGPKRDALTDFIHGAIGTASMAIILLTARNAPLKFGELEDYTRLNKQRRRKGRSDLLPVRPIRWDLHRFERRAGRGLTAGEKIEVTAHLCRGHFKMRKSGLFWWSPHYRGTPVDGPPPTGRDHEVGVGYGEMFDDV